MRTKCQKGDPALFKTDLLAIGLFQGSVSPNSLFTQLNEQLKNHLSTVRSLHDFSANTAECKLLYPEGAPAKRILWVGLGDRKDFTLKTLRKASEAVGREALRLGIKSLCMGLHIGLPSRFRLPEIARTCTEGIRFGAYRYDEYITTNDPTRVGKLIVTFLDPRHVELKEGVKVGQVIGEANALARTLANRPGNALYPASLAMEARRVARRDTRLDCKVYDQKQLESMGMGGILAVGGGSKRPPCLIEMRYKPRQKLTSRSPEVALVGKAVTFDSGGISIKPSADMDQMKFDKSGGIAVLATMKAIAELDLNINVTAFIPAAENMPGGGSYRPGDIVATYRGKTVEILNTDAEGRMILCDAIALAEQRKCDIIIDIATLTGACMVALGTHKAGLMCNHAALVRQFMKASDLSGEPIWHLPSDDDYAEEMKSKIADLKNCGSRWGGACTAAAFLRQFAGNTQWAHIDIAGMDVLHVPSDPNGPSSSGFGVRLLTMFLYNLQATTASS